MRDRIQTGFLEHALEFPELRQVFAHWSKHPEMRETHTRAMEWASACEQKWKNAKCSSVAIDRTQETGKCAKANCVLEDLVEPQITARLSGSLHFTRNRTMKALKGCLTVLLVGVVGIVGATVIGCGPLSDAPRGGVSKRSPVEPNSKPVQHEASRDQQAIPPGESEPGAKKAASTPATHEYQMRETISIGYTSYTVWKAWWPNKLSDNQFLNEKPDASWLFVELSVRNDDKKERTIPPFELIDENGAEYGASAKSWQVEQSIGILDSLNPGVSKQGRIVFDVPRNHSYKLKISGGFWSSDTALISIKDDATAASEVEQGKQAKRIQAEAERKAEAEDRRQKAEQTKAAKQVEEEKLKAEDPNEWGRKKFGVWLTNSKTLISKEKYAAAKKYLTRIVEEAPGTEIADEAQKLINNLPKNQ
ncbi:MAG: DUF4352 domain-containing protein [Planctomycetaceae bacterium]